MLDRIDELEFGMCWPGRDEFSRLKLAALKDRLPMEFGEVSKTLTDSTEQAAALRWILRGRSTEWAVGKVMYDRTIVKAIRDERRKAKNTRDITGY